MTSSFTVTGSVTFTITHARYLAAKIAADLKRLQRLYGEPSEWWIGAFQEESTALLKAGYLGTVSYGYQRNGNWIEPSLHYTASDLLGLAVDNDPGRIRAGANIAGANFYSYLTYSTDWNALSQAAKNRFKGRLPFWRNGAHALGINGYMHTDRTYSAGGLALNRSSLRSY